MQSPGHLPSCLLWSMFQLLGISCWGSAAIFRNLEGSAKDTHTRLQAVWPWVLCTSFQVAEDSSRSPATETSIEVSTPYFYLNVGKCPRLSISRQVRFYLWLIFVIEYIILCKFMFSITILLEFLMSFIFKICTI